MPDEKKEEKKVEAPALPENDADLQERINGFNVEIVPMLAKFELGLAALPKIMPNGTLGADPIVVSVRKKPELSKPE